jgi:hypothetical protein
MNLNNFEFDLLSSLFQTIEFSYGFSFLSSYIPIPNTLEESLSFLKNSFSFLLKEHFQQSISIISKNLSNISFENLNSLPIHVLELIFSNDQLQIPNEDFLFLLIFELIHPDSKKKSLY